MDLFVAAFLFFFFQVTYYVINIINIIVIILNFPEHMYTGQKYLLVVY